MKLRLLEHTDMPSINKWLAKNGTAQVSYDELPILSFIVPGVAAGALRRCEGDIGIMEAVVTNPLVSSETRHKALEAIFTRMTTMGINRILGFTLDAGTLLRAERHGFKQLPHVLVAFTKDN